MDFMQHPDTGFFILMSIIGAMVAAVILDARHSWASV